MRQKTLAARASHRPEPFPQQLAAETELRRVMDDQDLPCLGSTMSRTSGVRIKKFFGPYMLVIQESVRPLQLRVVACLSGQ